MKNFLFTLLMLLSSTAFAVTEVSDSATFKKEIIEHKGVIAIKFYSNQCPACLAFEGTYKMAEAQFDKQIKFTQIDVDKFPDFTVATGVPAIPAVLLIDNKNKVIIGAMEGATPPTVFENFLKDSLKKVGKTK